MADRRKPRPKPEHLDIISDVTWNVELEPEVDEWLDNLTPIEFALTLPHIERLAEQGNRLRMPASNHSATDCSNFDSTWIESRGGSRSSSRSAGGSSC